MKKLFLLCSISLSSTVLLAQVKKGTISYEKKVNNHRSFGLNEQMRAMMPEFRTSNHLLIFSDSISLYKLIPEDEAPDPFAGSGGRATFRIGGGSENNELFKNFAEKKSSGVSELAGKTYIIQDSIGQQPWKLTDETKKILGYDCIKAVRKVTVQSSGQIRTMSFGPGGSNTTKDSSFTAAPKPREIEVVAWYAPDLLSPAGPEQYGLLPGVILEINYDNGATMFTAKEIKKEVDEKQLKEPKKGKIISSKDFAKLRNDMLQEQMQNMGGSIRFGN